MPTRAKEFRYAVDLLEGGAVRTEDGIPLGEGPEWTPEHLVLAGLVRCSLESLRFHARRGGIEVAGATGSARAMVTKRESDERYAMVEAEVALDVRLRPSPGEDELVELLAKAERDCFVGASLTVKPVYRWTAE
jgi:organic hydroperoxide reductase OsmC/OhrA